MSPNSAKFIEHTEKFAGDRQAHARLTLCVGCSLQLAARVLLYPGRDRSRVDEPQTVSHFDWTVCIMRGCFRHLNENTRGPWLRFELHSRQSIGLDAVTNQLVNLRVKLPSVFCVMLESRHLIIHLKKLNQSEPSSHWNVRTGPGADLSAELVFHQPFVVES